MSERFSTSKKKDNEDFQQENPLKRRSGQQGSTNSINNPPPPPRKSEINSRPSSSSPSSNFNSNSQNNYENNSNSNMSQSQYQSQSQSQSPPSSRESRTSSIRSSSQNKNNNNNNNVNGGLTKVDISTGEGPPINLATNHNPIDSQSPKSPTPSISRQSTDSVSDPNDKSRPLQYALWGHYMGYGCAQLAFWFGITAILWNDAHFYQCRVNGQSIDPMYILVNGTCGAIHKGNYVCCNPNTEAKIDGNTPVGALYIIYGIALMFIENYDWGYGL